MPQSLTLGSVTSAQHKRTQETWAKSLFSSSVCFLFSFSYQKRHMRVFNNTTRFSRNIPEKCALTFRSAFAGN